MGLLGLPGGRAGNHLRHQRLVDADLRPGPQLTHELRLRLLLLGTEKPALDLSAHLAQVSLPRRSALQHLEDVKAVVGGHDVRDLPWPERESHRVELGRHHPAREPSQVAPVLGVSGERALAGQVGELRPFPELLTDLLRLVELLHDDLRRVHLLRFVKEIRMRLEIGADLLLGDRHPRIDQLVKELLLDQLAADLLPELVHRLVPLSEQGIELVRRPVSPHPLQPLLDVCRSNFQAPLRRLLDEQQPIQTGLEHRPTEGIELVGRGHRGPVGKLQGTVELTLEFRPGDGLPVDPRYRGGAGVLRRSAMAAGV